MQDQPSIPVLFPHGLRIFLRTQMPDGSLHNIDFPLGRTVRIDNSMDHLVIFGDGEAFLGAFSRDSFSFVLPFIPTGPGSDAKN